MNKTTTTNVLPEIVPCVTNADGIDIDEPQELASDTLYAAENDEPETDAADEAELEVDEEEVEDEDDEEDDEDLEDEDLEDEPDPDDPNAPETTEEDAE